jgi:hypothetical protein
VDNESSIGKEWQLPARKGRVAMKTWPKEPRLRQLTQWVKGESGDLTEGLDRALVELMDRVSELLDTPTQGKTQSLLIFSAALQCIQRAESLVLEAMRLDHWISMREEAVLVHLRIACHEMIGLLINASDDLRFAEVRVRH